MIDGVKVIATTPCGRARYMRHLAAHMQREHERGHVDEWILFKNPIAQKKVEGKEQDIADEIAACWPWVQVFKDKGFGGGDRISRFFKYFTEADCVYLRFDDDVVYIDENCVERLVRYRLKHHNPYLIFPTIINNVRTSYHLQQAGLIPKHWGLVRNDMLDPIAWRNKDFVKRLHRKALNAIDNGGYLLKSLVDEFALPSGEFPDYEAGYISINAFAMLGEDMLATKDNVPPDEERHFALWQPEHLNRMNARCGDAVVCHFAYHTQTTEMDASGMLDGYEMVNAPLLAKLPDGLLPRRAPPSRDRVPGVNTFTEEQLPRGQVMLVGRTARGAKELVSVLPPSRKDTWPTIIQMYAEMIVGN